MKQNEMAMGAAPAAGMDAGMGAAMPPAGAGMPQGGEGMEMEGETVEIPKAMFMAIYDVIKNLSSGLSEFATMLEGQAAAPEMQGGEMEMEKEKGKSGDEEFLASIAEEGNYK
jgi:hypothetical protein